MWATRLAIVGLATCVTLGGAIGCVKRKETVTIARDGGVTMRVEHEGSADAISADAASAWIAAGWVAQVSETYEDDPDADDGKTVKNRTITSVKSFPPRADIPHRWPAEDAIDAEVGLVFPTSVEVTRDGGSFRYRFERRYEPRRWAQVYYWKDHFLEPLNNEDTKDVPLDDLSRDKKLEIVKAFAAAEVFTQVELAREALAECEPDLAEQYGLRARLALLSVCEDDHRYFERAFDLCEPKSADDREACFDREVRAALDEGYAAFTASLAEDGGLNPARIARFNEAYDRAARYHKITDSTGGDQFEIEVKMPGTPVAHNGDKVETDDGWTTIYWQFDGKALRDRTQELIAITDWDGRLPDSQRPDAGNR